MKTKMRHEKGAQEENEIIICTLVSHYNKLKKMVCSH